MWQDDMQSISDKQALDRYCTALARKPLLVQGAGGNISFKKNNVLWIKASGMCLADAEDKNIFLPVDLNHLKNEIRKKNYSVSPIRLCATHLKPSIETCLHALMPQSIVLHLHPVEVLTYLVRQNALKTISSLLKDTKFKWICVDYYKPGSTLARAVKEALDAAIDVEIVFLKNHGIVVAGNNIAQVDLILNRLLQKFITQKKFLPTSNFTIPACLQIDDLITYFPSTDKYVHCLAMQKSLFVRLRRAWAICPDHVVFLGGEPRIYNDVSSLYSELSNDNFNALPKTIFIKGKGVFFLRKGHVLEQTQLRCYYEILSRQQIDQRLNVLTEAQILELVNWEAEKYRMQVLVKGV